MILLHDANLFRMEFSERTRAGTVANIGPVDQACRAWGRPRSAYPNGFGLGGRQPK
jgi:hypothetical protein